MTAASPTPPFRPRYWRLWWKFVTVSLSREMIFRWNFLVEVITTCFWMSAQLLLFEVIYSKVPRIQDWSRSEYFGFMATGMLINGFVEMLFMPNCANFSEQIRTGNLDFALVKPVDSQFFVSFQTVDLSSLVQCILSLGLLTYSLVTSGVTLTVGSVLMYTFLVVVAVAFFYSMMIALASAAVFMGRNQGLYDFWFYVTSFARYPGDMYRQGWAGEIFWFGFSFLIPILLVVTIPSRMVLQKTLSPHPGVILIVPAMTAISLWGARRVFQWALSHYRSASS
ncbi:MAG: hypothetical protein DWH91_00430 [Planctomycetota bacterium]|nr:MAG: hypothetical protein DWH91_00430 [Planctomycetota bacterium]